MRNALRILALLFGAVTLLVAVLSVSSVQTALVNSYFHRKSIPLKVGSAKIGWGAFELNDVRLDQGRAHWRFPSVSGDWVVSRFFRDEIVLGSVRAPRFAIAFDPQENVESASATNPRDSLRLGIQTLKDLFQLPFPVSIQELSGQGQLTIQPSRAQQPPIVIALEAAGSLQPASTSKLDLHLSTRAPDGEGGQVDLRARSTLALRFIDQTRIGRITASTNIAATGPRFPNGAVLIFRADLGNETDGLSADIQAFGAGDSDQRELLNIRAGTDRANNTVKGRWVVDLNQTDLRPYSLGFALPLFSLKGNGGFVLDDGLRLAGEWEADLPNPGEMDARFAAWGEIRVRGVFDAHRMADRWRIHRATTRVSNGPLLVALQLLQTADWSVEDRKWLVANPEGDVFSLEWQGLGADVLRPFIEPYRFQGRLARGGVTGRRTANGWLVRSQRTQQVLDFVWFERGVAIAAPVDFRFDAEAVIADDVIRADFSRVVIERAERRVGTGAATLTRRGAESWELTADLDSDAVQLEGLVAAPSEAPLVQSGLVRTHIAFSSPAPKRWQAQFDFSAQGLQLLSGERLGDLSTSARADYTPATGLDLEIPVEISGAGTKSDLLILTHLADVGRRSTVETLVTSKVLDANATLAWWRAYQRLGPRSFAANPAVVAPRSTLPAPFWDGVEGRLKVALASVHWPNRSQPLQVEFMGVANASTLQIEQVKVASQDGSSAQFKGELNFVTGVPGAATYHFAGVGQAREFDPAPYLATLDPTRPPLVEGRFDLDLSFKGAGSTWASAMANTQATLVLTGRGGKFRAFDEAALMADFSRLSGGGSRLASLVGKATSLFTNIDKRIAAGNNFMRRFADLAYDQATFELMIRPGEEVSVREFSLISPELRLLGRGTLQNNEQIPWAKRSLTLKAEVAVRGANERDLRTLGLIGDKADALGYYSIDRPIEIEGTLRDLAAKNLTEIITSAIER